MALLTLQDPSRVTMGLLDLMSSHITRIQMTTSGDKLSLWYTS